jgi:hypothetical protein
MEYLFSYGTLQDKNVQISIFGREIKGTKDILEGYFIGEIEIFDQKVIAKSGKKYHPILIYSGNQEDKVDGSRLELTDIELAFADEYEVEDYQRVQVYLESGRQCWAYVLT